MDVAHRLLTYPAVNAETIAAHEGCSVCKVNMTITLSFLAPDLAKARSIPYRSHLWPKSDKRR